jgi:hypothetical protein
LEDVAEQLAAMQESDPDFEQLTRRKDKIHADC